MRPAPVRCGRARGLRPGRRWDGPCRCPSARPGVSGTGSPSGCGAPCRAACWPTTGPAFGGRCRSGVADDYDLVWYSIVDTWWHDPRPVGRASLLSWTWTTSSTWPCGCAGGCRRAIAPGRRPAGSRPGPSGGGCRRGPSTWSTSARWDQLQRRGAASVDHVVVCSELDVTGAGVPQHRRGAQRGGRPGPAGDRPPGPPGCGAHARASSVRSTTSPTPRRSSGSCGRCCPPCVPAARTPGSASWAGAASGSAGWRASPGSTWWARWRTCGGAGPRRRVGRAHPGRGRDPAEGGRGAVANRLPMVTTTVGCEGIDRSCDGRSTHWSPTTPPGSPRPACVCSTDGDLRQRLADEGAELFGRPTPGHPSGAGSRSWRRRTAGSVSRHRPRAAVGVSRRTTAGEWRKNCSTSRS